jgi:hypothetical protein
MSDQVCAYILRQTSFLVLTTLPRFSTRSPALVLSRILLRQRPCLTCSRRRRPVHGLDLSPHHPLHAFTGRVQTCTHDRPPCHSPHRPARRVFWSIRGARFGRLWHFRHQLHLLLLYVRLRDFRPSPFAFVSWIRKLTPRDRRV